MPIASESIFSEPSFYYAVRCGKQEFTFNAFGTSKGAEELSPQN